MPAKKLSREHRIQVGDRVQVTFRAVSGRSSIGKVTWTDSHKAGVRLQDGEQIVCNTLALAYQPEGRTIRRRAARIKRGWSAAEAEARLAACYRRQGARVREVSISELAAALEG